MSLTSPTEYIIWSIIGLLWAIQMLFLLLLYHRVNREAKKRGFTLVREKADKTNPTREQKKKKLKGKGKKGKGDKTDIPATTIAELTSEQTALDETAPIAEAISPTESETLLEEEATALHPLEDEVSTPLSMEEDNPLSKVDSDINNTEEVEADVEVITSTHTIEEPVEEGVINFKEEQEVEVKVPFESVAVEESPSLQPIIEKEVQNEEEALALPTETIDEHPIEIEKESNPTLPNTEEMEKPEVDDEGFFGDLFGETLPRKQSSSGRKRPLSEDAGHGMIDELVISEEELRNGPDTLSSPLLFADDPDDKPSPTLDNAPMLSVVVVACNQDSHLRQNLPYLLEQDYPNYEVIVIDDNSNDDTADVLMYLQSKYAHLQTRTTPASARRISHRKLSMMLGIKAAQGEWLVFTEADCRPISKYWLSSMARQLPPVADPLYTDVDAVIAYTAYAPGKGVKAWIRRYDNMIRNARLLGLALYGHAPMAYGSNMLYRRGLFFQSNGFGAHLDLERGEDDLFVNENIAPRRIRAEIDGKAIILCTDNDDHRRTIEYLGRIATGRRLRGLMPHLLRADTVTRGLYAYATLAIIIIAALSQAWITLSAAVILWGVRYGVQFIVLRRLQALFGEADYAPWTPLFELAHPVWALRLHLRYLFTPGSTWHRKII